MSRMRCAIRAISSDHHHLLHWTNFLEMFSRISSLFSNTRNKKSKAPPPLSFSQPSHPSPQPDRSIPPQTVPSLGSAPQSIPPPPAPGKSVEQLQSRYVADRDETFRAQKKLADLERRMEMVPLVRRNVSMKSVRSELVGGEMSGAGGMGLRRGRSVSSDGAQQKTVHWEPIGTGHFDGERQISYRPEMHRQNSLRSDIRRHHSFRSEKHPQISFYRGAGLPHSGLRRWASDGQRQIPSYGEVHRCKASGSDLRRQNSLSSDRSPEFCRQNSFRSDGPRRDLSHLEMHPPSASLSDLRRQDSFRSDVQLQNSFGGGRDPPNVGHSDLDRQKPSHFADLQRVRSVSFARSHLLHPQTRFPLPPSQQISVQPESRYADYYPSPQHTVYQPIHVSNGPFRTYECNPNDPIHQHPLPQRYYPSNPTPRPANLTLPNPFVENHLVDVTHLSEIPQTRITRLKPSVSLLHRDRPLLVTTPQHVPHALKVLPPSLTLTLAPCPPSPPPSQPPAQHPTPSNPNRPPPRSV
jgi:hypothetical protein